MALILTIFVLFNQMQYNVQSLKNSRHGSYFGNEYGGFCIAAIEHPSPGFYIMGIWKDIKGYEGFYQVSNLSRVKSLNREIIIKDIRCKKAFKKKRKGKLIKPSIGRYYFQVALSKNGKTKQHILHRLVALVFIPNPENKPEINHKNGIKTDNRIENLEWCTRLENVRHAHNTGLMDKTKGEYHPFAKLNKFQVSVIRKTEGLTLEEIGQIFKISNSHVCRIRNNKKWKDETKN